MLHGEIQKVVCALLQRLKQPTARMIETIIQMELAYVNTNHPDFMTGLETLEKVSQQKSRPIIRTDSTVARRDTVST